jgi:excinuclease ABC subunit C
VQSVLDEIPGVGPSRRLALMRKYDSLQDIMKAQPEELAAIPEIPVNIAVQIHEYLNKQFSSE